jgi:IS30 family transposase
VVETAQLAYGTRRKHSKPKGKRTDDLITVISDKLLATWSPEQIANTVTLQTVSFKTIYNWLYSGVFPAITVQNLRQKGKRRKTEKRDKFSTGTPISDRPKEVKSRLYTAFKTPDRTAASMQAAITQLFKVSCKCL